MKSIKLKIWFSILVVTAVVIVCIWSFQVVLLERFYLQNKKDQIVSDTQLVTETINKNTELSSIEDIRNLFNSSAVASIQELGSLVQKNNYYLVITDMYGIPQVQLDSIGGNCILRNNTKARMQVISNLLANGTPYYLEDGVSTFGDRFYVGASYQKTDKIEYFVFVESALAPVHEAVSTIKNQLIYISVGLILLATLAAFILARSLTKPILQISQAAQEIAKGNLDVQVHVKSKDEIGRLSQDFNIMSREIAKSSTLQRELVANVSHDIRTPLTMIKGYAETIKDLTGDNKVKREEQLDVIIAESNRLNVLVNDILDLSKLQAGQQPLTLMHFDLANKLRDIMRRYDLLSVNEGFVFNLQSPEHVMVYADEVKMEQVIYNIINNATNHTGADKKVMVQLEEFPDRVIVRISDTGAGIKPEDIPLIWERYYKPYKKGDRKGMGTGLGLSIVKAILVAHGAGYGVSSQVGLGSTFWFEVLKAEKMLNGKISSQSDS